MKRSVPQAKTFCAIKAASIPESPGDEAYPVVFHVLCGRDARPASGIFITGVSGDPKDRNARYPFLLHADGRGDYGAACAGSPDRYFQTNFRSKLMKRGELFTVNYVDTDRGNRQSELTYKIIDVVPLAGPSW